MIYLRKGKIVSDMEFKYHYTGEGKVHIAGVEGYCEPNTDIISTQEINHPFFKLVEKGLEKETEEVENKEKKKKKE